MRSKYLLFIGPYHQSMVVCGSSVNGLRQQEIGALIKVHMGCYGNEKKKEKIQAGERLP